MKRKTYKNFMLCMDILQNQKHYSAAEAERLTRMVWDHVEEDRGRLNRPAEYFLSQILSWEEYVEEYGIAPSK